MRLFCIVERSRQHQKEIKTVEHVAATTGASQEHTVLVQGGQGYRYRQPTVVYGTSTASSCQSGSLPVVGLFGCTSSTAEMRPEMRLVL